MKAYVSTTGTIFTTLLVAMILPSCSSDDQPSMPMTQSDAREIRFAASTDMSRADITTNSLKSFYVYAYTGNATSPKLFMDNVMVSKNATNVWTYSPVAFWPAKESVDFYAYAPAGWLGSATPVVPVEYDDSEGLTDLVYAVSPNLSGNTGSPNAQVLFNFRHALSKVSIKLSSTNSSLQVKVSNVVLANIDTKGNFHFPGESTAGTEHTVGNVGKWTDQNSPAIYVYHISRTPSDVITLTSTPNDLSAVDPVDGGPKYLVPQTLTWEHNGSGSDNFLTVMCSVYDTKTGVKLWPNANTPEENVVEGSTFGDGLLRFPLSTAAFSAWQPGNHYVYNVVINSNDEMGTISFGDPSVETYVSVESNYN